ncbi:hypothetical protein [Neobacillus sp. DY30]|uniref:hypothetical protein n=1 Tax=Neobacillus sp. DY30 TaxID=3047871 RepID=UPI0024BF1E8A|nr:hypothetical protein [Neobacillus sp. DY30]WHX99347.1 hypothetical protein QNH29_22575 [Neobacillus sp. DY30]
MRLMTVKEEIVENYFYSSVKVLFIASYDYHGNNKTTYGEQYRNMLIPEKKLRTYSS